MIVFQLPACPPPTKARRHYSIFFPIDNPAKSISRLLASQADMGCAILLSAVSSAARGKGPLVREDVVQVRRDQYLGLTLCHTLWF